MKGKLEDGKKTVLIALFLKMSLVKILQTLVECFTFYNAVIGPKKLLVIILVLLVIKLTRTTKNVKYMKLSRTKP